MRKLIKSIFKMVLIFACIVLCLISAYMYKAYQYYQDLTSNHSIEERVMEVMEDEHFVSYSSLPKSLVNATVAIEDRRYFYHNGVDIIGVGRAIVSQFSDKYVRSGGSTITQQTAKNLYGMFDSNILNKGCQMFMAWELETKYTKEEILSLYVNIINYGNENEGIYEASLNYFNVLPSQLTDAQASLLAGIPQSPSYFELVNHYDNAKTRQLNVLIAMADCGYISEEDINIIWDTPVFY